MVKVDDENFTVLTSLDGSGNIEYVGKAARGSSTSNAVWQIKKITYTSSQPTALKWADGLDSFTKVWDDRATYTYS